MPGLSVNEGAPWGIVILILGVVATRLIRSRSGAAQVVGRLAIGFVLVVAAGVILMFAYWSTVA